MRISRLRAARERLGLTQIALGRRCGVNYSTISLIERGKRPYAQVSYAAIVRIARDGLDLPVDAVFPVPRVPPGRVA